VLCDYFLSMYLRIFSEKDTREDIAEVLRSSKGKTKPEKIVELLKKGFMQKDIANALGVNRRTVIRAKKKMGEVGKNDNS